MRAIKNCPNHICIILMATILNVFGTPPGKQFFIFRLENAVHELRIFLSRILPICIEDLSSESSKSVTCRWDLALQVTPDPKVKIIQIGKWGWLLLLEMKCSTLAENHFCVFFVPWHNVEFLEKEFVSFGVPMKISWVLRYFMKSIKYEDS